MSLDDKITIKKSNVTIIAVISVVVLVVFIVLTVYISSQISSKANNSDSANSTLSNVESSQLESENYEMLDIETDYCVLKYPSQWEKYLEVKDDTTDGVFTKTFLCNISNLNIKMFEIHFGKSEIGDLVGYITTGDEKTPVYVEYGEFSGDNSLSKDDETIIYAMFEGVNDVVQSIKKSNGFSID